MSNLERLTLIFRQILKDPAFELKPELAARDVKGWDSLAHINLLMAVEKAFAVKLEMNDLMKLRDVGSLSAFLASKGHPLEWP